MMKPLTAAVILAALSGTTGAQDLMGDRDAQQIITEFETSYVPEMPELNIGDQPPAFKIEHWVKGTPISEFEKGNVYLIDFWATWCGPCIKIMPELTQVQEKYADDGLRVVGVSIWENKVEDGQRVSLRGQEQADHVQAFVEKNDERMGYTVAVGSEDIESDWMQAAQQNGIPTVMIVDRSGHIGWIGYGTDPSLDENLEDILADEHDIEALNEARIASLEEESGPNHYQHFLELAKENKAEAGAFGQAMLETLYADNPNAYNAVAWTIVEDEGWSKEAVAYATKIATEACEMTDWESPMVLDTLAWAQYRSGDAAAAVETEQKAIELLGEDDPSISEYKKAIETFQGG